MRLKDTYSNKIFLYLLLESVHCFCTFAKSLLKKLEKALQSKAFLDRLIVFLVFLFYTKLFSTVLLS